jgi:nicotinate-nucleotide--dimethylbenzimidazole phosphoribosyltransferase
VLEDVETVAGAARWQRPVPTIGDRSTAAQRAADLTGWAFSPDARTALHDIVAARRDVRRFRPDDVPPEVLQSLLAAAHAAPSVGHSQPWRFIVVTEDQTRAAAALLADRERLAQAAAMDDQSGQQLLDLQLEGIRESPVGIVVCCDRRAAPVGVLGRATFPDSDLWSCACAIQNLWLTARAHGLGVGWVTLFRPKDLAELLGLPDGVVTLGWLCIGYPDERQPSPGLERAGWSQRLSLDDVVIAERWPAEGGPEAPRSRVKAPEPAAVVGARDAADVLLTPLGSLGVLDRALDRVVARMGDTMSAATLILAAGDHPVADLGVTAFSRSVTAEVVAAARAGQSIGVVAANAAGISSEVFDAGSSVGDLLHHDALPAAGVAALLAAGEAAGRAAGAHGLVLLGEVGIGNTTVAAALGAALMHVEPRTLVGLGAGSDSGIVERKRAVVTAAVQRVLAERGNAAEPFDLLAALGGPEFAYLCGVVLGAASAQAVVVLDGMVTSVAALVAVAQQPEVASHLVAGQVSREFGHRAVLQRLGLEPLLDLRLRAGEGVGAVMAAQMLLSGLEVRRSTGRVAPS